MEKRVGALVASVCLSAAVAAAQPGGADWEWRSYAGDLHGTRYAPLDQITADNFETLEVAWRWGSADAHLPVEGRVGGRAGAGGDGVRPARGGRFPTGG